MVTLGGLIVLSNDNGFPLDYIVETYYNQEWTTASSIINSDNPLRYITFPPRKATQVRITVTRDQITKFLEYTRINEVYPLFANLPSTVSTPSTPCPASASLTPCPKPKNSHAGAIAGAVVGGVLGLVIAGLAVCILLKRRKQPVEIPPVETPPENIVHDVPKNTGMQELDGTRMARFGKITPLLNLPIYLTFVKRKWGTAPGDIHRNDAGQTNTGSKFRGSAKAAP